MLSEINISILIIAIIISLYIAISNAVRRFRFLENKFLIALCILGVIQFLYLLFQNIYFDSPLLTLVCKLNYGITLFMCVMIYALIQIYPRWDRIPIGPVTWLIMAPGIICSILCVPTDLFIIEVRYEGALVFIYGPFIALYHVLQFIYFVGTFVVLIYKNRHEQNESFKRQFVPFLIGISVFGFCFTMSFMALPFYYNIHDFTPIGVSIFWIALYIVMNYSVSNVFLLNYKRLYLKVFLWLTVFFAMLVPAYIILRNDVVQNFLGMPNLTVSSSILIPIVFFSVFWSTQPAARYIANWNFLKLERAFRRFYEGAASISEVEERDMAWDYPLKSELDLLVKSFQISNALFYVHSPEEKMFHRTYFTGAESGLLSLEENGEMIKCIKEYEDIIERSMFFSDEDLWKYRDALFPLFKEHNIEVAVPVVNLDGSLSAVLFLGRFRDGSLYTKEFIDHLKPFADHFGFLLVKCVTFENARKIQVVEHDKMVIASIKKRIIPSSFDQTEGLRISSLFINNSEFGGDYFDSVRIGEKKAGIFIANTYDTGINSSMLALQMYTILHAHAVRYESSEKLLNLMNQAIATAKYSEKHAAAFYLVYSSANREIIFSNAAFNPLLVFDAAKESFSEYTGSGLPLGVNGKYAYRSQTVKLSPGSTGMLYSDGLYSAIDRSGEAYSISRIMDIIRLNRNEQPSKIVRLVYDDLRFFTGGVSMVNDMSLVVFRAAG